MRATYSSEQDGITPSDIDAPIIIFSAPSAAEREELLTRWELDEHAVASALDPDEISRVDVERDHVFIIWKRPDSLSPGTAQMFEVSSVGIRLSTEHLVMVLGNPATPFQGKKFKASQTLHELLMAVMLETVYHYLAHLKVIRQVSKELQVKLNTSLENAVFLQMFSLSESLVYYRNAIDANGGVLAKLRLLADKLHFTEDERELLDDIVIENRQCLRQAEIYESLLSGLMDARGNIVNNNMNVLLKNLTVINIVFLPLNLLASIGGMSEYSSWTSDVHWTIGYGGFLLGLSLLGLVLWRLLTGARSKSRRIRPR